MDGNIKNVRIEKIIKITKMTGDGTEEDPNRIECEYWTMDGKKII